MHVLIGSTRFILFTAAIGTCPKSIRGNPFFIFGPGLSEICKTVCYPPVLDMGSCVDNRRIILAATEVVNAGELANDIIDLPDAGSTQELNKIPLLCIEGSSFNQFTSIQRLYAMRDLLKTCHIAPNSANFTLLGASVFIKQQSASIENRESLAVQLRYEEKKNEKKNLL